MELRFGDAIDEHISKLNPLAIVYIGIFQAVSRAAVGNDLTIGYVPWGPWGRAVFFVETPFETDPQGNSGPRGLRYYVATAAPSQKDAVRFMLYGTQKLHTMMQLSANAAAFPIHMRLMSIRANGNVPFRELLWEPEIAHPMNTRIVDDDATKQLFSAAWRIEDERLARAAVQYEVAMRRFQNYETLLAIEHLYMGVETILKMYIRKVSSELGLDEIGLAAAFGIDPKDPKRDHKVEIEVRRQLIFANDAAVYKNIRMISDGMEHGFKSWEEMWSIPDDTFEKSAGYLRSAILYAADLPDAAYQALTSAKYAIPVKAGDVLAFEATAPLSKIDLRKTDFKIAKVERVMTKSEFDEMAGEYRYDYRLEAPKRSESIASEKATRDG